MVNTGLKLEKYKKTAQISLRLMAMATTLTATCLVLTTKQTVVIYGTNASAKYSYSPAYKFFAAANITACVFSAISLLLLYIIEKTSESINYFFFFLHDLVVSSLLMAACSAATAVGGIGQHGNKYAGWIAICGYFSYYCNKLTICVTLSYIAFLFYFVLAIISSANFKSASTTQAIK